MVPIIPTNTVVATIVHHDLEIPENLERAPVCVRRPTAPLYNHGSIVGGRPRAVAPVIGSYCPGIAVNVEVGFVQRKMYSIQ